jgi:hypothetical protein
MPRIKTPTATLSTVLILAAAIFSGCTATVFTGCFADGDQPVRTQAPGHFPGGFSLMESSALFTPPFLVAQEEEELEEEKDESSTLGVILLYIPNRILDLFDVARFGVNVGPGFGFDVRCTKWLKAQFITDTSVGVGLQTLRHLPLCFRSQSKLGLAFISTPSMNLIDWHYGDYDLRVELYVLLVGAHVAVELGEIVDFIGGIFTWDPMNDDFRSEL